MEPAVIKEIGVDVFMVVFTGVLFWMLVSTSILVNNLFVMLLMVLAVPIWIACLAVVLGMTSNYSGIILTLIIPATLVVFGFREMAIIVAASLMIFFLAAARWEIIGEHKSRKKYKTRYVFYPGTKMLVMATIILLAGISMPHITESLRSDDPLIPESSVNILLKPYESFLTKNIPGGSVDLSIEDTVEQQLREQYPNNPAQVERQKKVINEQLSEQLSEQFQQDISPSDSMSSVVTSVLNEKIKTLINRYPVLGPVVIFGVIILVSRIFIPAISFMLLLPIAFIVWVARKANLLKLLAVSEPVEHLEL